MVSRIGTILLPVFTSIAIASPTITFDKKEFDCGTFDEGSVKKIHASFVMHNSGDAPLHIQKVKPGCGCTVATFDSLINPGKSGTINADVNLNNGNPGPISKPITVTSDAANDPIVKLTITAIIQSVIGVSEPFITLGQQADKSGHTITVTSRKKDLVISGVSFKAFGGKDPEWQSANGIPVAFKMKPDSVSSAGVKSYVVTLTPAAGPQDSQGEFIFKTNHPEKNELRIGGRLTK